MTHVSAPSAALHPQDAAARGITPDGLVRVESEHGSVVMRAALDDGMRRGEIFVPMHWTDQFASCGPVGRLVHAVTDPVSGQPDLKATPVRVTAMGETWRGVLLRLADGVPEFSGHVWWAKAPAGHGHAFELSGWMTLEGEVHSEGALRRLLQIPAGAELISYSDPARAMFRYAGIVAGRLAACVFFGPPGAQFPAIDRAKMLLGQETGALERVALLAGLKPVHKHGKIVCACFGVGEEEIRDAIRGQGLRTPAAIGAAVKAGTNCGSCLPEIRKLIGAMAPAPVP
jgi:assimilatory nitrate reductase catalytic subunit